MKLVKISDLFEVKYGVNLELINLEECRKNDPFSINFISRTEKNNGISAYVKRIFEIEPNPANTISVAGGGSVLATFYHKEEYYSGRDIYILNPKKQYSDIEMLFYAYCIRQNKYRYNYGRQANKTLKDILIPETMPLEWQDLRIEELNTLVREPIIKNDLELRTENWRLFKLFDIFDYITLGTPIHKTEFDQNNNGDIAYITRTAEGNGIECWANSEDFNEDDIEDPNCITIGAEGFTAFYQPKNFITGNKVNIFRSKHLNKYNALFMTILLNKEVQKKFNYGRGATKERLSSLKIKLPVTKEGLPDWEFMENYIKSLSYSKCL